MKYHKIYITLFIILINLLNPVPASADNNNPPETNGKAVVLMDASSGRVLYERNSHLQLPPASVTKIMTALLVVENGDLDKNVVVSEHAADTPEATIYLEPGETLSRIELLYGAMLPSANDAATVLAESVSGNEESFIELMNKRADQLGMKDTHYCNPHGLNAKEHYSSAYDLALLAKQALSNQVFAEVVGTKQKSIPWASRDEDRVLINQNRLLYRYDGAIGVKTGYTTEAGNCVVGAARKGNMTLIAVSLNSPTVYDDLQKMLDYGFENYQMVALGDRKQFSGEAEVIAGEIKTVPFTAAGNLMVAAKENEIPYLSFAVVSQPKVEAPVKKGDVLGNCTLYISGEQITSLDLLATQSVNRVSRTFAHSLGQWMGWILSKWYIYIAGLVIVAVLYKRKKNISFEECLKRLLLRLLRKKIEQKRRDRQQVSGKCSNREDDYIDV